MPIFTLNTNVPTKTIPADFLSSTAKLVAELLRKPVSYVVVHVHPDQMMSWAGSSDPCAIATLESIGNVGESENLITSKKLFEHIKQNLGIESDHMYISFNDLKRANVGYMGKTFAAL